VKDLLTHGSGIMSGGLGQSQAGANGQRRPDDTLATYIPRLAAIPIDFQPGTLWRYSGLHGLDIAARIVEIASGQPYNVFLKQRLFDPLGMKDTGFALPAADPRLVPLYTRQQGGGFTRAADQGPLQSATYFSASGGLVSTIEDYLQFAQMLVNGGELNGRRYLSPRTVSLIASNHTGNMLNGQFGAPAQGGIGFGLGVQVVEDPVLAGRNVSKGAWGWAGAYGTNVHIEPAERMVQIIFMNVSTGQLQRDFEAAVQQAIVN
jgi:CubicO group peptidase (beta-lactamase class C family)